MSSTQPLPLPTEAQPQHSKNTIPMLVPVFIIFFLFMCFLSIFILRDILRYLSAWLRTRALRGSTINNDGGPQQGLDPKIISSFPTLPYSALHKLRDGNCDCECPICLSEFNMDDVMRLLTVCCHAFHPECIDSWLASHTTCPICRSDLEEPPTALAAATVQEVVGGGCDNSHVIVIDDEESFWNSVRGRKKRGGRKREHNKADG